MEQRVGGFQPVEFGLLQAQLMAAVFPREPIEGRGQLGDRHHPGHGGAALERVQSPAHFDQRLTQAVVGTPAQPVAFDLGQQLVGFFKEYLAQLGVDFLAFIGQCAMPTVHAKRRQAGPGHVDERLGVGQRISHAPLQIAFAGTQRIGQVGQFIQLWLFIQMRQPALHIACGTGKQLGGSRQHEHRQCTAHLLQQPRQGLQALTWPARFEAVANQVLGLLQHRHRFAEDHVADVRHVRAGHAALAAFFQRADHTIEGCLDVQQRPGNVHQQRIVDALLILCQSLQRQHLIDDDPPRLLEIQHCQGVCDLTQGRDQGVQLLARLLASDKLIEAVLDPHQVIAQRRHHRTQGVAALASL
ncbi:hypothetical protein PS623_03945 [Pseudomonas fluorescens]|nr:hypothetical protein PS623_03945 [Pseudomonas fluorescens]